MKKLISLLALAVLTATAASAQISAYKHGVSASVDGYSLPRTIVEVTIVQEREVIIRGPYARYASQYLGVSGAPMSDRESYKVLGASLSWATEPDPTQIYAVDDKTGSISKVFSWLPPQVKPASKLPMDNDFEGAQLGGLTPFSDMGTSTVLENNNSLPVERTSAVEKSAEQMAADAANVIFKIRKRRVELICGDQGENVFGAGLKAALEEMDRIEKEYVTLFLGKRYVQRTEHHFSVVPEAGKARVVAFRFTPAKGVVGASDLSADPINLEFAPIASPAAPVGRRLAGKTIQYRVPQIEHVTLTDGVKTFAGENIPIFQKGVMVEAPIL